MGKVGRAVMEQMMLAKPKTEKRLISDLVNVMLQITKKDTTTNTMVGQKMNRQFTKKAILKSRRQGKKKIKSIKQVTRS